jgi:uncharacterized iron-regulated membrane protein
MTWVAIALLLWTVAIPALVVGGLLLLTARRMSAVRLDAVPRPARRRRFHGIAG